MSSSTHQFSRSPEMSRGADDGGGNDSGSEHDSGVGDDDRVTFSRTPSPAPPQHLSPHHHASSSSSMKGRVHNISSPTLIPPPPAHPVDTSIRGLYNHTLAHLRVNPAFQYSVSGGRIALCAVFLGVILGTGIQWCVLSTELRQLGLYALMLAMFHILEFMWTAIFHPNLLSATSFLLNHSPQYHLALVASLIEYLLEYFLFPSLKSPHSTYASLIMYLGLFVVLAGQGIRTVAMFTAGGNFTHVVAQHRKDSHQLVTYGIYSLCRHPSYAGWFWWSVGTQILLCNPICVCAYAGASYMFFKGRINFEERTMINFFGDEYIRYQSRVPTGVPFVKGFQVDKQFRNN